MNQAPLGIGRAKLLKGATGDFEVVVGLEVHAQVTSNAKLFSGASTAFGGEPNAHVSLVDAALPGMLPVINQECIAQAVRTGLGLKAKINLRSVFDRKNYFYPDLPQGYQISQYKQPIVGEGTVTVDLPDGQAITVGIERLHLEQDAGKSIHDQHASMSLVDLNRSGVALMEIVTKPDLRSAEEAKAFVTELRSILRWYSTCDGDMEKGSLRADVNVSVRRPGEPLGTRCEIKNVNSIRFIGLAIESEARRQIGVIEDGGTIEQETRLFDPVKDETRSMRSKEEAHDYRYFPDPDLLPLELDEVWVKGLKDALPESRDEKKDSLTKLGLSRQDVNVLAADREVVEFFEATLSKLQNLTLSHQSTRLAFETCKWVSGTLFGALNATGLKIGESPISPNQLAQIICLVFDPEFGRQIASQAFMLAWENPGKDPRALVESRGLRQITDTGAIEAIVDKIIAENPAKAAEVAAKPAMLGWFVGQAMKASGGKANPQAVNELLKAKLGL